MKTKTIKQSVLFNAELKTVYSLLMDAKKHSAFTNSHVKMSKKTEGKFETFDGYIHGYNIELIEPIKIVQAWHFDESGWPDNHFSICTFFFEPTANGTRLKLTQTGVPEEAVENLKSGWIEFYWEPMKNYLAQHK